MADNVAVIAQGTFVRGNLPRRRGFNVAGRIEGSVEVDARCSSKRRLASRAMSRESHRGSRRRAGKPDGDRIDCARQRLEVAGDLSAPASRLEEGALTRRVATGKARRRRVRLPASARAAALRVADDARCERLSHAEPVRCSRASEPCAEPPRAAPAKKARRPRLPRRKRGRIPDRRRRPCRPQKKGDGSLKKRGASR